MSSTRGTQPAQAPKPTATTANEGQTKNYDKLLAKLNERGNSLLEFGVADDRKRKRMLKDDYAEIKEDAKWMYDEPIEFPADVLAKEAEKEKAKLEALSKAK